MAAITAEISGTVWKIQVAPGDVVSPGDTILILESMKMEVPVEADVAGTVVDILVSEGDGVTEGDTLAILE